MRAHTPTSNPKHWVTERALSLFASPSRRRTCLRDQEDQGRACRSLSSSLPSVEWKESDFRARHRSMNLVPSAPVVFPHTRIRRNTSSPVVLALGLLLYYCITV